MSGVRVTLLVVLAATVAVAAYAAGSAGGGDPPKLKRIVVAGSTDMDATIDKWVTAECPDGMTVVGGGAQIPVHTHDTPGIALYWSAPYASGGEEGWWAAAHDTKRGKKAWVLQVSAVCMDGVEAQFSPAGSLPAEEFSSEEAARAP